MRGLSIFALLAAVSSVAVFACSGSSSKGFDESGDGGSGSGDDDDTGFSGNGSGNGDLAPLEGGVKVSLGGDCQAGHYGGTFTGTYSSYLTFVGAPIPVAGDVSLDLKQGQDQGGGEFPTYTIENGSISGTADLLFPYYCKIIGALDCSTKKLNAGIDCTYCLGTAFGDLSDGGTCFGGHFLGPLAADYDAKSASFVNGQWAGSEKAAADDAGLPEGGSINDAGLYVGPGNYGGNGLWNAKLGGTASANDK